MRDSLGEVKIYNILTDYHVPFSEEQEFPDLVSSSGRPLRFDFCVFNDDGSVDFLIEYQGKQHYKAIDRWGGKRGLERQQYNDAMKRRYCIVKQIPLVIIPYWDENRITYEYIMHAAGY